MKRFITFLLAFTMLASMGGSFANAASAEGENPGTRYSGENNTAEVEVKASYISGGETIPVYCVSVVWGDLNFKASIDGNRVWDPGEFSYFDLRKMKVDSSKVAQILVTNRSNVGVVITPTLDSPKNEFGINAIPSGMIPSASAGKDWSRTVLESAESANGNENYLHNVIYQVGIAIDSSVQPDFDKLVIPEDGIVKIGTVTITVSADESAPGA